MKFLKFLLLSIATMVVIDILTAPIVKLAYSILPVTNNDNSKTYFFVNKSKADIYIIGSSRSMYHYNPKIIEQVTGEKTLTIGTGMISSLYGFSLLKASLKRHVPNLVVYDYTTWTLSGHKNLYSKAKGLLNPYYYQDDYIKEVVDHLGGKYTQFEMLSNLYRMRFLMADIPVVMMGSKSFCGGYVGLPAPLHYPRRTAIAKSTICDYDRHALLELIEWSRQCGFQLLVVISPRYSYSDIADTHECRIICQQQGIPFLDYSDMAIRTDFHDDEHLNQDGSTKFSLFFAKKLETFIKDKK